MKIHKYIVTLSCKCKRVNEQVSKQPAPKVGYIRECYEHGARQIAAVEYRGKVQSGT